MIRLLVLLAALFGAAPAYPAGNADSAAGLPSALADGSAAAPSASLVADADVPLRYWNRQIMVFRVPLFGASPEERAARALQRLDELPLVAERTRVHTRAASLGSVTGRVVLAGDRLLFALLPEDVDILQGETLEQAAQGAAQRVQEAIDARIAQSSPRELLIGAALSGGATLGLLMLLWVVLVLRRALLRGVKVVHARRLQPAWGAEVSRHLVSLERGAIGLLAWGVALVLVYLWLGFVLTRFPYTAPWGHQLGEYLAGLSSQMALGVLHALPGLFAVFVVLFAARYVVRVISAFASSVEQGRIQVGWLEPQTVEASRRVSVVLVWLFALTVAYPYIPGSDTTAFKGVSVVAGLMITIGSAGFIGHLMAGLLVVYARALRKGEMVKVGDTFGVVTEVGALSTKVTTPSLEEVTIPNAVLMSTTVTNFSRLAGEGGAILSTKVTIGYDAPWRQVHALLLLAAERTAAVRKEPKPFVLQTALSDFYVEYELRVHLDGPENRFTILSDLHAQIQDAFNEFGVQIMSPHFMLQPDGSVTVKRDDWFAAPASEAVSGRVQAEKTGYDRRSPG
ncbi:MAG: mechanosensitive ion channel [Burkholderiales bacterium]|nr:mechanosensitive ion channel [Burkholderiales bacterium]